MTGEKPIERITGSFAQAAKDSTLNGPALHVLMRYAAAHLEDGQYKITKEARKILSLPELENGGFLSMNFGFVKNLRVQHTTARYVNTGSTYRLDLGTIAPVPEPEESPVLSRVRPVARGPKISGVFGPLTLDRAKLATSEILAYSNMERFTRYIAVRQACKAGTYVVMERLRDLLDPAWEVMGAESSWVNPHLRAKVSVTYTVRGSEAYVTIKIIPDHDFAVYAVGDLICWRDGEQQKYAPLCVSLHNNAIIWKVTAITAHGYDLQGAYATGDVCSKYSVHVPFETTKDAVRYVEPSVVYAVRVVTLDADGVEHPEAPDWLVHATSYPKLGEAELVYSDQLATVREFVKQTGCGRSVKLVLIAGGVSGNCNTVEYVLKSNCPLYFGATK